MLKKYYSGGFFGAPIPHKWYQNTSGFAAGLHEIEEELNLVRRQINSLIKYVCDSEEILSNELRTGGIA